VGTVAHHLFPAFTATPGAYALVGMGAVFAGIVRAPMTSVVMIFEMTQDYAVIVPLMIANLISLFIASRLQHEPIYEALAVQDGIHLPKARQRSGQRQVASVMQMRSESLPAEITVREARERVRSSELGTWVVLDQQGVVGVISLYGLERELADGADKKLGEIVDPLTFPHVHSDQGLDVALERMGVNQIELLPVVGRANVHELKGIVTLRDVLDAYGVSRTASHFGLPVDSSRTTDAPGGIP
jgi:CIC family chloride channel protein